MEYINSHYNQSKRRTSLLYGDGNSFRNLKIPTTSAGAYSYKFSKAHGAENVIVCEHEPVWKVQDLTVALFEISLT